MKTADINPPYSKFALPYSLTSETNFSEKMSEFILTLLPSQGKDIKHIIDLACGVGFACHYFSKKGYQVSGVDISLHMLKEAQKRAIDLNLDIEWYHQNMMNLSLPTKGDLVTCMYDSINFMLNSSDLSEVFQRVYSSLLPKGHFVFDVYTIHGMSVCWGNQDEIHTNEPLHFIASKTYWNQDTHVGSKTLYGFSCEAGNWERWEEKHIMRAYSLAQIRSLLLEAGFKTVKEYDVDNFQADLINESTRRAIIVAG